MSLDDMKQSNEDIFSAFEEVNTVQSTKRSHAKLSKRTRTLILTSGLAVLLAIILLVLTLLPDGGANGSESSSVPAPDTSIVLLDKSVANTVVVSRVDIRNADDTYSLVYDTTNKRLTLTGYEDITLNEELTDTLIAYTTLISAADQVETPGALKDYGLDTPTATGTITYTDGTTATLTVGNLTPAQDRYYVQISGNDGVYMFDSDCVYLFTVRGIAFADTTLLSTPTVKSTDTDGTAVLKEVSYSGQKYPTPFKIRRSYSTDSEEIALFSYVIAQPYQRGASDAAISQLTNFQSLQAAQALYLHPTAEQKKKLGFNDPLIVMDITMAVETTEADSSNTQSETKTYYNSYSTTITVGSMDSRSNYIVMAKGIDAIFLVENSALSAVAERTYDNTVNQLLFLKNISQFGRLSITTNGQTHDFYLTHHPEKEDNDATLKVTCDGKEYPTGDFRELYQMLMSLERYGTTDRTYDENAVLKVDVYTNDGALYLGATYYPISGTLCAVKTNEGEVFTTRWRNVTHFIEQVENYLNGNKVIILT